MPAPSPAYSSTLEVDRLGRRVLLVSASASACLGLWPLATLAGHGALPVSIASAAWLLWSFREIASVRRQYALVRRIRLAEDLSLDLADPAGNWRPGQLLPGSLVLGRLTFLRFEDGAGRPYAELFYGQGRSNPDLRRLRVLLRLASGRQNH